MPGDGELAWCVTRPISAAAAAATAALEAFRLLPPCAVSMAAAAPPPPPRGVTSASALCALLALPDTPRMGLFAFLPLPVVVVVVPCPALTVTTTSPVPGDPGDRFDALCAHNSVADTGDTRVR